MFFNIVTTALKHVGCSFLITDSFHCMKPVSHSRFHKSLIVGLGNYGYDFTRHNVGMDFLNYYANSRSLKWTKCSRLSFDYCHHIHNEMLFILLKPRSYMNISGISVNNAVKEFKPDSIIVIHDELDKKLGKFSWKKEGSCNGHRGLLSIEKCLGGKMKFQRLRVGIDRPDSREHSVVSDYVLGKFSKEELALLMESVFPELDKAINTSTEETGTEC